MPYDSSDYDGVYKDAKGGIWPPRPTDPSQSQWLRDPVWDVIKAGWHSEPEQRCELRFVYRVFLTSGQQEVQDTRSAELDARNTKVPDIEMGQQQRGKVLPRITSFFQSLRDSESKVQKHVDEIDQAGATTFHSTS